MNIRYFNRNNPSPSIEGSYYCVYGDAVHVMWSDGDIWPNVTIRAEYIVNQYSEIAPPDPGPIEERYINATDQPSVEGFKY